jgi:hypothetical protein
MKKLLRRLFRDKNDKWVKSYFSSLGREWSNPNIPNTHQMGICKIHVKTSRKVVTVTLLTTRPGSVIGKGGSNIHLMEKELEYTLEKLVKINVREVRLFQ